MPISLHLRAALQTRDRTVRPDQPTVWRRPDPGGIEALGPLAKPHLIGCTAQITQIERLEEGRMNIIAIGLERFQIHTLSHDKPYLVGNVESFPLDSGDYQTLAQASQQLRPWVERYLATLSQVAGDTHFDSHQLPDDPLSLGYLAAALVQIPMEQKQTLLAADHAHRLLADIRTIYRREVPLLNAIIEREANQEQELLFSRN
jgi:Lon protease-like protein